MHFSSRFQTYHDMAQQATGFGDFGSDDYQVGLKLFLQELDGYTALSEKGIEITEQQIIGLLCSRLIAHESFAANPAAFNTPIEKPIFVIGMARTGTTVLHRLLALDPQTQALPFWLSSAPIPRPPREQWESHPLFQQVKQALDNSGFMDEELLAIHPVSPEKADECRWAIDQSFWATTLAGCSELYKYHDWLTHCDASFAYRYHKKVLQVVANGDARRWVLKDPSHISGIDSLLKIYPDACIVNTHRNPVDSFNSTANLIWAARKAREPSLTHKEHGQWILNSWIVGLNKMEQVRREVGEDRFVDLHMSTLKADPIGSVERIYNYFDLPISDECRANWESGLQQDPNFGHKKHTPPDFGLTAEAVNSKIPDYYGRYQLVCEQQEIPLKSA